MGQCGKPPAPGVSRRGYVDLFARNYAENQAVLGDQALVDFAVAEAGKRVSVAERARAALERGTKTLKAKPGDLDALMARTGAVAAG